MRVLVAYDVSTQTREGKRRLRRIANLCRDFGVRVQLSLFECRLSAGEYRTMRRLLLRELDPAQDSLRFYIIGEAEWPRAEHFGVQRAGTPGTAPVY